MLSCFSHVQLLVTPWTAACQAPLSTEFCRQESWSGLLFPSPGYLLDPGIQPASLMSPALTGGLFNTSPYLCIQFSSVLRHLNRHNAPGHGYEQPQLTLSRDQSREHPPGGLLCAPPHPSLNTGAVSWQNSISHVFQNQ